MEAGFAIHNSRESFGFTFYPEDGSLYAHFWRFCLNLDNHEED